MKELKETVSEIKNIQSKPKQHAERRSGEKKRISYEVKQTHVKKTSIVLKKQGVKESEVRVARKCQEYKYGEVQKNFNHMDVECNFNDQIRLGQGGKDRNRTLLLKLPIVWQKRLILS